MIRTLRRPFAVCVDLAALALLLPLVAARAALAPAAPTFLYAWGGPGAAPGLFGSPFYVATDASGNVYVPDPYNNRVQKFDPLGSFLGQWGSGGTGTGQFNAPTGVAIDASGNVYITDYFNNRVQKFDANGSYLLQWGTAGSGLDQFNGPEGIAVDPGGNVYVGDYGNNRVEKFSALGVYLAQWGAAGAGSGQFNGPEGIAVDASGNVLVVDSHGNRVERFTSGGAYLGQWGGAGSGNGQFNYAGAVAVDPVGNIYVADVNNARVQKFDRTGAYLAQWGTPGSGNGQFNGLFGVAVDVEGNVYTTEDVADRIQKFSGAGAPFTQGAPGFLQAWGSAGAGAGQFSLPSGVAGASYASYLLHPNVVYVADSNNNRIEEFTPGGTFIAQWGSSGGGNGQFNSPSAVAADGLGYVYVADELNSRVEVFDQFGNYVNAWYGPNGHMEALTGVVADGSGGVYALASGDDKVYHLASNGTTLAQWGTFGTGPGQFSFPSGIAGDAAGFLYIVDRNNASVMKFTGGGVLAMQWGSSGTGPGQFSGPTGVAVSGDYVYVADGPTDRIEQFTTDGLFVTQWGAAGSGNGQFSSPNGLGIDPSGSVLVADQGNNRIQSFAVPPAIAQVTDVPRDQGGQVRVRFERCSADAAGSPLPIQRYDVYRRIDPLAPALMASRARSLPPPSAPAAVTLAGWDLVASVYSHGDPEYDVVVPTLENATPTKSYYSAFFVRGVTAGATVFDSGTDNGLSIDNLSPPAPTQLAASYAGGATHLQWASSPAADFAMFRIYRGTDATFIPSAANLLAATPDNSYVDPGPSGSWYAVTALDVNGNEGPAALIGPSATSTVPIAPPLELALARPQPNPAVGGGLTARFTLPAGAAARLELVDVAGRAVVTREVGALGAGTHAVDLAPRGGLAAGLYFLRLTQGAQTRSARITVLD